MENQGNTKPVFNNTKTWLEENQKFFLPPVCNKMMHNEGQMKMFFVGGPNQRKDYHIECGEELFYMLKGDMVLKVIEKGQHRDLKIREGELFLLPGNTAHSPQRFENTIGWVIERERALNELDGLRYYIEESGKPTLNSLYEAWFHCTDLGSQLAPIIKAFFASEQYKTGKPIPGTIPENPPITLDFTKDLGNPIVLRDWIHQHKVEIEEKGQKRVYSADNQFQVFVYGKGNNSDSCKDAETNLWQWDGECTVIVGEEEYKLNKDDMLMVPKGQKFTVEQGADSFTLVAYQDPTKSKTWPK